MSRIINKQMFNKSIKEEYLSTLEGYPDDGTAKIYRYAFYRSFPTEDTLSRDLYTFSSDEIEDALRNADHTTIKSIRLTFYAFKDYLKWAVNKGYSSSNIMVIETIKDEDLKNYLDKSKKLYFTDEELREYENVCKNYQDMICLRLPFEGVAGYQLSELSNLHYYDVNWNKNIVELKDDKYGKRMIKVSDECLRIMNSAYRESDYQKVNGKSEAWNPISSLFKSDYIFKNIVSKRTKNVNGVDRHTVYRRLKIIGEELDLPYLTTKNIQKSGMIKMGKDLYERDGELTNKQLAEIAEQFGLRTISVNGYEMYNYTVIREVVNQENIMDLYGIDINE